MTAICGLPSVRFAAFSGVLNMRTSLGALGSVRNVATFRSWVWEAAVFAAVERVAARVDERDDREDASVVVGSRRQVQLCHHALHVLFDRALAYPELMSDADVRPPLRHLAENVALTCSQLGQRVVPAP